MLGQNVLNDIVRKANRTQLLIDFLVLARTLYLLRAKVGGVMDEEKEWRQTMSSSETSGTDSEEVTVHQVGQEGRRRLILSVSQLVCSSWILKVVALGGLESGGAEERVSEGRKGKLKGPLQNFPRGTGSHPALWDEGEVESGLKSLCYVAYRR